MNPLLQLIRLHGSSCEAAEGDDQLLARFAATGDVAAFEGLLNRYGPMVYSTCRRRLAASADAEDAFQATFLALVCHARSIRRASGLGGWLHQTAVRVAGRVRQQARRRDDRERERARPEGIEPLPLDTELREVLDEELDRLPEKYRRPVILCHLLNRPLAAAAQELGVSTATVWRRLGRGEELLRKRLASRGVGVPAGVILAVVGVGEIATAMPDTDAALRTALAMQSGRLADIPPRLLALAELPGGSRLLRRLLFLGLALGVGTAILAAPVSPPQSAKVPTPKPLATVIGTVVDDSGRPAARAKIAVVARRWEGKADEIIGRTEADANGKFSLEVPPFTPQSAGEYPVKLIAAEADGPGRIVADARLSPGRTLSPQTLKLPLAGGVVGRVFDAKGPVGGAIVAVNRYGGATAETASKSDFWPLPVRTADDGSFRIPGVEPTAGVQTTASHPERGLQVEPATIEEDTMLAVELHPVRKLAGTVRDAAGKPVPRAGVLATSVVGRYGHLVSRHAVAGADGQFEIDVPVGSKWWLRGIPNDVRQLPVEILVPTDAKRVAISLAEAAVVRGRVRDGGNGKPIGFAKIGFLPAVLPKHGEIVGYRNLHMADADGTFAIPTLPGGGTVFAIASDSRYATIDLVGGRAVVHAAVEVKDTKTAGELSLDLTGGTAIEGRAVLPDGAPVASGFALVHHLVGGRDMRTPQPVSIVAGRFVLPGCRIGETYAVYLVDREAKFGATAKLSCDPKGETPAVKLAPCAAPEYQLLHSLARPAENAEVTLEFLPEVGDPFHARWWSVDNPTVIRTVSENGVLTFPGLVPGASYRLRVILDGQQHYEPLPEPDGTAKRRTLRLPIGR